MPPFHRRRLLQAAPLLALPVSLRAFAQADNWPQQPIKIIVPFAAGGATDVLARVLTERLAPVLKQPVMADNKPGVGSTLGATLASQAKGDGYTLLMMSTSHLFAPAIYKDLTYDALTSFVPVARLTSSPYVLTVNPGVPAQNVAELVALAKSQPGKLNYGSSGTGGNQHLVNELFLATSGVQIKHIPYKGSGQSLTDLIGGQVQMSLMATTNALPHVKSGKLRALAITSLRRSPDLPDVPTLDESGYKGFEASAWLALAAPKGTPPAVVARLDSEIQKMLAIPEVQKQLAVAGQDIDYLGAEAMPAFLRADAERWLKLARGLKLSE